MAKNEIPGVVAPKTVVRSPPLHAVEGAFARKGGAEFRGTIARSAAPASGSARNNTTKSRSGTKAAATSRALPPPSNPVPQQLLDDKKSVTASASALQAATDAQAKTPNAQTAQGYLDAQQRDWSVQKDATGHAVDYLQRAVGFVPSSSHIADATQSVLSQTGSLAPSDRYGGLVGQASLNVRADPRTTTQERLAGQLSDLGATYGRYVRATNDVAAAQRAGITPSGYAGSQAMADQTRQQLRAASTTIRSEKDNDAVRAGVTAPADRQRAESDLTSRLAADGTLTAERQQIQSDPEWSTATPDQRAVVADILNGAAPDPNAW